MRLYISYVEFLKNRYNAVDEIYYDAIKLDFSEKCTIIEVINKGLF